MLEGTKITHHTFKETPLLWRKIGPWCMTRGKNNNNKKSVQTCSPGLKKVQSYLYAQNKPLKPIKFTKPKIVLFTFQISASMRHFANMLRLQNVQVDKDMQRWPFNKSQLSQERLCPPGPQVPKNRDGVQWSWQCTTQDPVTWGRSFTVRKPCPTPVLHPDQQEPLRGSRRHGVEDCFLNKCARKKQEILMLPNLSISEQNKELVLPMPVKANLNLWGVLAASRLRVSQLKQLWKGFPASIQGMIGTLWLICYTSFHEQ